jgi:hypothetical protein
MKGQKSGNGIPNSAEGVDQSYRVVAVPLLEDDADAGWMLHLHPQTGHLPLFQRIARLRATWAVVSVDGLEGSTVARRLVIGRSRPEQGTAVSRAQRVMRTSRGLRRR